MFGAKNHYEQAFSGWLIETGVRALAVEQARRPVYQGVTLKNFDVLVEGADGVLALDVKGRRDRPWVSRTDLFSMMGWNSLLQGKAQPGFLFAFYTPMHALAGRVADLACTRHETPAGVYRYCLLGLADAQRLAKPRSASWATLDFEWGGFARAVMPLDTLLQLHDHQHQGAGLRSTVHSPRLLQTAAVTVNC